MAPSPTLLILCKGGCSFCASTKRRAGRTCLQARPFLREMQVLPARSASNLAPAHCNYEADATQWSHAPRTLPISILSPVRHRPAPKRRPRSINCRIFTKLGKPCDTISACFERCARNALIVRVLFRTKRSLVLKTIARAYRCGDLARVLMALPAPPTDRWPAEPMTSGARPPQPLMSGHAKNSSFFPTAFPRRNRCTQIHYTGRAGHRLAGLPPKSTTGA